MQKLKNIEFLRVMCTFFIVFYHIFHINFLGKFITDIPLSLLTNLSYHAQKAVDFFFIMAGFFLVFTFKPTLSLFDFFKKRVIRFWPVMLFVLICYGIGSIWSLSSFYPGRNILTLLFINNIGLPFKHGDSGNLWFVSVLIWCSVFYFLMIKHVKLKLNIITFLFISIISYSLLLFHQHGDIRGYHQNYYVIVNIGMLRGLAGMGLGCLLASFWKNYKALFTERFNSKLSYISLGCIELTFLILLIYNSLFHHLKMCKFVLIILFVILFVLFLINKGFVSQFFDRDIWVKLSKYTYSIYVIHIFVLYILKNSIYKYHIAFLHNHSLSIVMFTIFVILVFGIFTYHFVEEPCAKYLTNKFLPRKVENKEN